jgi:hypothetical protein
LAVHDFADAVLCQILAVPLGAVADETIGHSPRLRQEQLPACLGDRGLTLLRAGIGGGGEVAILLIEHMLHMVPVVSH